MLKSTAGGGGIGMRVCADAAELREALRRACSAPERERNFDDGGVFLEKYVERARHVEVQIFGDGEGRVLCARRARLLGCSAATRRSIEETPAPGLDDACAPALLDAAVRLCARGRATARPARSSSSTTPTSEAFYFLEVNTRLQVEHGVTEAVTGVDLVEWMVRLAAGELELPIATPRARRAGTPIEVRVYAEDPAQNFRPSTGMLTTSRCRPTRASTRGSRPAPRSRRTTTRCSPRSSCTAQTRARRARAAARRARATRASTASRPTSTTCAQIVADAGVRRGAHDHALPRRASRIRRARSTCSTPGTQTTVQDYPGPRRLLGRRRAAVGSDGRRSRSASANRLVGNRRGRAGARDARSRARRCAFDATRRSRSPARRMRPTLDGKPVPPWRAVRRAAAGATLRSARSRAGLRAPISPCAAASTCRATSAAASTFTLGRFGGHGGRALRAGDVLHAAAERPRRRSPPRCRRALPTRAITDGAGRSACSTARTARPTSSPRTTSTTFFATDWEVHYNSDRTGVRLIGPKPRVGARRRRRGRPAPVEHPRQRLRGRRGRLHRRHADHPRPRRPEPRRLRVPGDDRQGRAVEDRPAQAGDTRALRARGRRRARTALRSGETRASRRCSPAPRVRQRRHERVARARSPTTPCSAGSPRTPIGRVVVYRRAGDDYLLVEYGPLVLDLALRFRVHALMNGAAERAACRRRST